MKQRSAYCITKSYNENPIFELKYKIGIYLDGPVDKYIRTAAGRWNGGIFRNGSTEISLFILLQPLYTIPKRT